MKHLKIVLFVLILLSVALNIFLEIKLFAAEKTINALRQSLITNTKVLHFSNLFIDKVLRANGEISFEDRLGLENAVRDTQDKDIYDQWQKFVNAKTEHEGREAIKNLLQLMVNKLSQY